MRGTREETDTGKEDAVLVYLGINGGLNQGDNNGAGEEWSDFGCFEGRANKIH